MERIKQAQKGLPIWQHKEEILEMIKTNQVVIVAGDTGCGKSTQVGHHGQWNLLMEVISTDTYCVVNGYSCSVNPLT